MFGLAATLVDSFYNCFFLYGFLPFEQGPMPLSDIAGPGIKWDPIPILNEFCFIIAVLSPLESGMDSLFMGLAFPGV